MTIRNFKKSDLESVFRLAKAMIDYHHQLDSYYKPANEFRNLKKYAEEWLKEKDTQVLVAEEAGEVIGYSRVGIIKAPDYAVPKSIGFVYDVLVAKPYRRQGVGEQLFKEALNWLKKNKVRQIELNVDARNNAGINFWKKFGFFEYKLRMRKDL